MLKKVKEVLKIANQKEWLLVQYVSMDKSKWPHWFTPSKLPANYIKKPLCYSPCYCVIPVHCDPKHYTDNCESCPEYYPNTPNEEN